MSAQKHYKVGIVGAGSLASSILEAWLEKKVIPAEKIWAATRTKTSAERLTERYSVQATHEYKELIQDTEVLLLGIKPYQIEEWLSVYKESLSSDQLIISLMAGKEVKVLEPLFSPKQALLSVMTNTPSRIQEGVSVFFKGSHLSEEQLLWAKEVFSSFSKVFEASSEMFHKWTALIGCSPAFVFHIMDACLDKAREWGFKEDETKKALAEVFRGSARLLEEDTRSATELIADVVTPGGATEAGLNKLKELNVSEAMKKAMTESDLRSQGIAQE